MSILFKTFAIVVIAGLLLLCSSVTASAVTNNESLFLVPTFERLSFFAPTVDTPKTDTTTHDDTLTFDLNGGFVRKHHRTHAYSVSGINNGRHIPYLENFAIMDFNRVTGYFLGLGTPGSVDLGAHDELGVRVWLCFQALGISLRGRVPIAAWRRATYRSRYDFQTPFFLTPDNRSRCSIPQYHFDR